MGRVLHRFRSPLGSYEGKPPPKVDVPTAPHPLPWEKRVVWATYSNGVGQHVTMVWGNAWQWCGATCGNGVGQHVAMVWANVWQLCGVGERAMVGVVYASFAPNPNPDPPTPTSHPRPPYCLSRKQTG